MIQPELGVAAVGGSVGLFAGLLVWYALTRAKRTPPSNDRKSASSPEAQVKNQGTIALTVAPPRLPPVAAPERKSDRVQSLSLLTDARSAAPAKGSSAPRKKAHKDEWLRYGQRFEAHGVNVSRGLLYVSERSSASGEPSTIDLSADVVLPTNLGGDARGGEDLFSAEPFPPLPLHCSYAKLTPTQRGAYLLWLSCDVEDIPPALMDPGFVFLYFYGIERRAFIETEPTAEMGRVASLLLQKYAYGTASESVIKYVSGFLLHWAFRQGPKEFLAHFEWLRKMPGVPGRTTTMGCYLSAAFQTGNRIPIQDTLFLFFPIEEGIAETILTPELLGAFIEEFEKQYPLGLAVKSGGKAESFAYTAANKTARRQPISVLAATGKCEDAADIRGKVSDWVYARAGLGNKRTLRRNLADARPDSKIRERAKLEELLARFKADDGFYYVKTEELLRVLNVRKRQRYTNSQLRDAASALQQVGYALEPNPFFHTYARNPVDEVALLPFGGGIPPQDEYLGLCAIAQLSALIARATKVPDRKAGEVATLFLSEDLPSYFRERIQAYTRLILRSEENAAARTIEVCRYIPASKALPVVRLLFKLALTDRLLTEEEETAFRRVFACLRLKGDAANQALKMLKQAREGVEIARDAIQKPADGGSPAPIDFSLDVSRIEAIRRETAEVIGILSSALAEAEEADEVNDSDSSTPLADEKIAEHVTPAETSLPVKMYSAPEWMEGLEYPACAILEELVRETIWTVPAFTAVIAKYKSMPSAVASTINEWSDEKLGDFLVEGDGPYTINTKLLPDTL